jgi:hypothetical protein
MCGSRDGRATEEAPASPVPERQPGSVEAVLDLAGGSARGEGRLVSCGCHERRARAGAAPAAPAMLPPHMDQVGSVPERSVPLTYTVTFGLAVRLVAAALNE